MFNLLKESHAILATIPQHWTRLSATLSPDLLKRAPAEGEWSALDCLQHLVDTERWVFPVRVRAFLAGEDFPAFDPETQGKIGSQGPSPSELAAEFAGLRADSLALIETLTEADLDRKAAHGELGPVTLGEMLHE